MTERPWYQITAHAPEQTEILIYDQIGEGLLSEGVTAKQFVSELQEVTTPRITLRINSPGGSVFDGLAIYNALRAHPAQVTSRIDGLAASIASVIALAGERVEMAANALFMIHNPAGGTHGSAAELRKTADLLDKVRDTMVATYAPRCALTDDELLAAMDAETWYSAAEAAELGFADAITDTVPLAASFDMSAFRRPPATRAGVSDVAASAATLPTKKEDPMTEAAATPAEPSEQLRTYATNAAAIFRDSAAASRSLPTLTEWIIASGRSDQPRLAEYARRIRAAANDTLKTDVPGLIPAPIVTPVVSLRDAQAPLFNALGPNAAPDGASFRIPKITTNLAAAVNQAELADVTGPIDVADVVVTMSFVKRSVNISYEAIQYSNPGVVGVAQSELVDAVLLGCEAIVKVTLEAATGTNTAVVIALNGSDVWSKLSGAVSAFYAASGQMPDVFATAPDVWAKLAGFVNAQGQPLIPTVNQALVGQWGSLYGMPVVVSPTLTAGKAFLLSTYGVKSWASSPVNLQLSQPTTFAYQLGGGRNVGLSIADGKFITPVSISATTE